MLQDFNIQDTLEKLRKVKEVQERLNQLKKELEVLEAKLEKKQHRKSNIEDQKSQALTTKKHTSVWSKIASIFHRGEYYIAKKNIEIGEEQLLVLEKECRDLEEKIEELNVIVAVLKEEQESKTMPPCMREDNGVITITSGITGLGSGVLIKDPDSVPSSQKVLIRCTNFFPKGNKILSNYDGGKIGTTIVRYHGVQKETSAISHRHEVHCTINNRVENTGAGEGNWDNPIFIVIERYDVHEDEMESSNPSDGWTKGTSMKLSENAVIMVRIQEKDKLPIKKEEMHKYKILYYDGDPSRCLQNFLRLNGYDIFKTDPNCAAHAYSERIKQEKGSEARNLAINFVKDNTFFSKDSPIFSEEDISQIVDVGCISAPNIVRDELLCSEMEKIPEDKRGWYLRVANFVLGTGLKETDDGRYTFKSDDEILADIEACSDNSNILPSCVDVNLIYKIFQMQQGVREKHKQAILPSIEEIETITLDELYKFKNQLACEALQKSLPQNMDMVAGKGNIRLQIYREDCPEIGKKIREEDGIQYVDLGWETGQLILTLDSSSPVSEISKAIVDFLALVEEIKNRPLEVGRDAL